MILKQIWLHIWTNSQQQILIFIFTSIVVMII